MKNLLGTDFIIEEVLKTLNLNPWDDLLGWNSDAHKTKYMRLSYSKMKHVTDHSHPLRLFKDGSKRKLTVCSTDMGSHSVDKSDRKNDLHGQLGLCTDLYFKMLKYVSRFLLICGIVMMPLILINEMG
jgi:hypothetical protein